MMKRRKYWSRRESSVFAPYTYSTGTTSVSVKFLVRYWHHLFVSYKALVRLKVSKAFV